MEIDENEMKFEYYGKIFSVNRYWQVLGTPEFGIPNERISDNPAGKIALDCWDSLGGMLKVDPVQATPEWEKVIYEVEKEVDEELKDEPRGMGFCFGYWSAKRAALARRGIEWRSPSEMNPRVIFD